MTDTYTEGLAFILEGATEKMFYKNLLEYFQSTNPDMKLQRNTEQASEDIIYDCKIREREIVIKMHTVGTITQIVHSGKWFVNRCAKKYKVPWAVCLCYDTDSSTDDISKFYEGDWKRLRNELLKNRTQEIIDLAASADIEDVLLCDLDGICSFLKTDIPNHLSGRKGKAKMKALYRNCGATYHEGERAENMIKALNMEKIIKDSPVKFDNLVQYLMK